jgi:hypothetical protein
MVTSDFRSCWSLTLRGRPVEERSFAIKVWNNGEVEFGSFNHGKADQWTTYRVPNPGPHRKPAIKSNGEFNTLLVTLQGLTLSTALHNRGSHFLCCVSRCPKIGYG